MLSTRTFDYKYIENSSLNKKLAKPACVNDE